MKRKLLSVLLATVMLLTCIPLGAVGVSAETSDDYTYTVSDGEATITGYTGSGGAITIPSTLGGYPVTTIGFEPFWGCTSLTSVNIPDSVTTIGDCAFYECTNLTSVTIPDSVTTIGGFAFYDCDLTSVTIPDSVITIGSYAFSWNSKLTSIVVDKNNPYYCSADGVLFNKNKTKLIRYPEGKSGAYFIPNSVTAIGDDAFSYCNLTSVTIPDSVTTIGDYAFHYCTSLTSVTIPDSVTTIGSSAFEWCTSLTSVTIGDSVTTIGSSAFEWCESLTSVIIPDSVTTIGIWAFYSCTSLTAIAVDENNTNYCSADGVLFNKDKTTLVQYPAGKSSTIYTIPDSVTIIGDWAFPDCINLTSVTIPDSVTTIGSFAFGFCASLTDVYYTGTKTQAQAIYIDDYNDCLLNATWHYAGEPETTESDYEYTVSDGEATITGYTGSGGAITIPSTLGGYPVTTIGYRAFYECTSLTSVTIPDSVTSIGDVAFGDCTNLTSVTIPDSVTTIGIWAFYSCTSLTSVTIGDSVTTIGEGAFEYCTSLTSVTIPDSVTTISYGAFYDCKSLTSVTIPDCVTSIGSHAFYDCDSLTSVTIPDSVTTIGSYAFYDCDSLTSVTIPDSVTTIDWYAFYDCDSLTSVTIGDSVTTIGSSAFYGTGYYNNSNNWENGVLYIGKHLIEAEETLSGSYSIKDGTLTIAVSAFRYCTSLTSVTIPDSVTEIGSGAFYKCTSLTDVYYGGNETDKANITISSGNTNLTDATWHYNCVNPKDLYAANIAHSVMDTENGNGLAFRFQLEAEGVTTAKGNVADLTNATVNYLGQTCKLVGMGAVVTNSDVVGTTDFTQDAVNGVTVMDVPVVYLCDYDTDYTAFSIRIINIPDSALERTIYARPYYIVEVEGEQITVYGDVDSASCAEYR